MTNKERFANTHNLSNFAKNNPKFSIILAVIFIPIFPIIFIIGNVYVALKNHSYFKYLFYDWKGMIKMPKILFNYINYK